MSDKVVDLQKYKESLPPEVRIQKAFEYAQRGIAELERRIKLYKKELEDIKNDRT